MVAKAKNKLSELDAFEVSIVPMGKNLKKFLIRKELEDKLMFEEILKEIAGMKIDNEAELDKLIEAALPEEIRKEADKVGAIRESVKAAKKIIQGVKKNLPGNSGKAMDDLEGLVGLKKQVKKEEDIIKELVAKGYEIKEPVKPEPKKENDMNKDTLTEIAKMLDTKLAPVTKELEEIKKENKTLAAQLKEAKDKTQKNEFVSVAKELGFEGEQVEKMAVVLKEANESMSEDSFKVLKQTLSAQATQSQANNIFPIFKELGSSAGGAKGSNAEIDAAKAEVKKEHTDWTDEQVESEAFERNPDLYNKYLNENPAQVM